MSNPRPSSLSHGRTVGGKNVPLQVDNAGILQTSTSGGGGGGGAVTIADGADVVLGSIADAAVAGDANGTIKGVLRYLAKGWADVWDSSLHWLKVSIQNSTLAVTQSGTWAFVSTGNTTATLANVASSATSVTLQASNANRRQLMIVNDSTAILYVKLGTTASVTSYTYQLPGTGGGQPVTLELPVDGIYTGIVTGIWASATGNARVTEVTP